MLRRCNNEKDINYHNYGGRGIFVCERWHDYANFLADMGERPDGLTIERKDNNDGYHPDNCKWATMLEQGANRRNSRKYEFGGEKLVMAEIVRRTGSKVNPTKASARVAAGKSVEEALTQSCIWGMAQYPVTECRFHEIAIGQPFKTESVDTPKGPVFRSFIKTGKHTATEGDRELKWSGCEVVERVGLPL